MVPAALIVVAVFGVITWLAISAREPSRRLLFRRILLTVAIVSTIGLAGMVALFFVLMRAGPNSPAGLVALALAIPCAIVAVPSWIGFVVQARLTKR
jgi:F0F1-type ATP synthase membrane subunit c/vacuolar-type H+-ATPase subunit K